MKNYKAIAAMVLMGAALTSLTGCQEKEGMPRGRAVSFKVVSGIHETKAAYSGTVTSGAERIDWANGDQVRIYCDAAKYGIANSNSAPTLDSDQDQKFADYSVSGVTADGKLSNAKINSVNGSDGKQLLWGSNVQHDFYAVYPKPAVNGVVTDISGKTVTGTVKAAQANTAEGEADFSDGMVMVAQKSIANPQGLTDSFNSEVFLQFAPITTAIKFSVENGMAAPLTIKKVELISESHALSGDYYYDIDTKTGTDKEGGITAAEKKVGITKNVTLTKGGSSYVFTFLLRPGDNFNDLSIVITDNNDVTYTSELKTSGGAYTFNKGSKTVITGIVIEKVLNLLNFASLGAGADIRTNGTVSEEILF